MMVTGTPAGAKSKLSQTQWRELTFNKSKAIYVAAIKACYIKFLIDFIYFLLLFVPL